MGDISPIPLLLLISLIQLMISAIHLVISPIQLMISTIQLVISIITRPRCVDHCLCRGGSRNSSRGGGGVLGRNSSREGGYGPGPREFSYTDKQKKPWGGGGNPPPPGSATALVPPVITDSTGGRRRPPPVTYGPSRSGLYQCMEPCMSTWYTLSQLSPINSVPCSLNQRAVQTVTCHSL